MIKLLFFLFLLSVTACSKTVTGTTTKTSTTKPASTYNAKPFTDVPSVSNMAIYELNIPAFSPSANFKGATSRLDTLKHLGINVIWLMPIYQIGVLKSIGSPYCVKNYTEVNPAYGTLTDLRNFVNAAHKDDMAVILDWVADHTSWDNPWIKNKSWYHQDANGNIISPPGTGWTDVAQLNYSNNAMRAAMIKAMKYWITQANVDGFRCDAADMIPDSFWHQAIDSLKAIPNRKYVLLAEGSKATDFINGFQMNYAWNFSTAIKAVFKGANADSIFVADSTEYSVIPTGDQKMRYITNHDESSNGSLLDYYNTASGSVTAYVITAFLRGVPLIYTGQAEAYPNKISFFQGSVPPVYSYINTSIYDEYRKIMSVRDSLSTLINTSPIIKYPNSNVVAYEHENTKGKILIIANVRNSMENFSVPTSLVKSVWTNTMSGSADTLSTSLSLSPYQYLILKE